MHNTNQNGHQPTQDAYRELVTAFDFYNARLFDGQLAPVLFTYQRQPGTMGYYAHDRFIHHTGAAKVSELAINPGYFLSHPVRECLQTLVHEQCHQWQAQYGKPSRNGYHNAEWAERMEQVGLMPSDTGEPGGKKTGQRVADYAIAGGPFELATDELLASGFHIAWLDRYPPKDAMPAPRAMEATTQATELANELASAAPDRTRQARPEPTPRGTAALIDTLPAAVRSELVITPASVNRSNRVKYTCGCGQNLWGKPALRVRCEVCEQLFVAQL